MLAMHRVFDGINHYQDSLEHLPTDLEEVCAANAWWCLLASPGWVVDGWGQPLLYRPSNGDFEIRSLGPDHTRDTDDDLVLTSYYEREQVDKLAGCYSLSAHVEERLDRQLVLTMRLSGARNTVSLPRWVTRAQYGTLFRRINSGLNGPRLPGASPSTLRSVATRCWGMFLEASDISDACGRRMTAVRRRCEP